MAAVADGGHGPAAAYPVALHQHVWNPDGPRRALVVHGVCSDGATMWRLAAALAERDVAVTAPDLRGHGLSPPTSDYPLAGYAADVARLGSDWDLVVGHSLGGSILAHLLARHGFARRAVLIDPVLVLPDGIVDDLVAGQLAEVAGRETIASVLDAHPRWSREDVARKVAASSRATGHLVERTFYGNLPWDLRPLIARWHAPVHVLVAGIDPLIGPDTLPALTAHDVTIVGGAGHSIHRDEPDAVIAAVVGALDEHGP